MESFGCESDYCQYDGSLSSLAVLSNNLADACVDYNPIEEGTPVNFRTLKAKQSRQPFRLNTGIRETFVDVSDENRTPKLRLNYAPVEEGTPVNLRPMKTKQSRQPVTVKPRIRDTFLDVFDDNANLSPPPLNPAPPTWTASSSPASSLVSGSSISSGVFSADSWSSGSIDDTPYGRSERMQMCPGALNFLNQDRPAFSIASREIDDDILDFDDPDDVYNDTVVMEDEDKENIGEPMLTARRLVGDYRAPYRQQGDNVSPASTFLRRRSSVPVLKSSTSINIQPSQQAPPSIENWTTKQEQPYRGGFGPLVRSRLFSQTSSSPGVITPKRVKRRVMPSCGGTPSFPTTSAALPSCRLSVESPTVTLQTGRGGSTLQSRRPTLTRCFSESVVLDEKRVDRCIRAMDHLELAGDCQTSHSLPTLDAHGLRYVEACTVADLIGGVYSDRVDSFTLVDCRYPYEYSGGHIRPAINIYSHDGLVKQIFDRAVKQHTFRGDDEEDDSNSRTKKSSIVIFHCEFSSQRAPTLARFLRSVDRSTNLCRYPFLYFPEVYILQGGYSEFFRKYSELCAPHDYIRMHDERFRDELAQSKRLCKASRKSCLSRLTVTRGGDTAVRCVVDVNSGF